MVLTATVTKKSVELTIDGRYNIAFNLSLKDGEVVVANNDYSCRYKSGDNIAAKLSIIMADMQKVINNYKAQQVIYNSKVLNNAVTTIQNGLTV